MSIKRNLRDIGAILRQMRLPQQLGAIGSVSDLRPTSYPHKTEAKAATVPNEQRRFQSSTNQKDFNRMQRAQPNYLQPRALAPKPPLKSAAFNDALVVYSERYLSAKERRDAIEAQRQAKIRARAGYFGYE